MHKELIILVTVIMSILNLWFYRRKIAEQNKDLFDRCVFIFCPGINFLGFLALTWMFLEDLSKLHKQIKKEAPLKQNQKLDSTTKEKILAIFQEYKISRKKCRRSFVSNLLYRVTGGKSDYLFLELS